MKIYMDVCALKRPFDDRSQPRIEAEAVAVLEILGRVQSGNDLLVWSSALKFENDADPDLEVRQVVAECGGLSDELVVLLPEAERRISDLVKLGLTPLDAAHLALAEAAGCDVLLTCDDRFMRRANRGPTYSKVLNPVQYLQEVSDDQPPE